MGIWKKFKKKVKHGAGKVKDKVKKVTKKTVNKIEDVADDTFDFAVNKGKSLDDKIDNLADAAEDLIKKGISEMDVKKFIESQLKEISKDLKKEIIDELDKHVVDKIEDVTKKGFNEVEDAVTEKLPDKIKEELEDAMQSLAKAVTKEGLKKVRGVVATADKELTKLATQKPDLVDSINELTLDIEIGPLTLSYANFYSRIDDIAEVLDKYANHPPKLSRKAINQMVLALGPTSVDFGLSIQAALFVVSSNEIGVGVAVGSVPLKLFTEISDLIMIEIGIPA